MRNTKIISGNKGFIHHNQKRKGQIAIKLPDAPAKGNIHPDECNRSTTPMLQRKAKKLTTNLATTNLTYSRFLSGLKSNYYFDSGYVSHTTEEFKDVYIAQYITMSK